MNTLMKIGLGLCLAIVYPFMIGFGIEAFYIQPKPAYENCLKVDPNNRIRFDPGIDTTKPLPYREPQNDQTYKTCYDKAQEAVDIYSRNVFLLAAAFGLVAIIVGTLLFSEKVGPVGPGLVFGGLFTILYGTMRTFRSVDKRWIFVELVIVFISIILVTWRYLSIHNHKK